MLSEIFALYGMMETQHQAAIAIGEVHPDILHAAAIARASYEAGLGALRTGNTFGDVVDAMEQPLLAAGCWHVHPLIHSLNPYGPVGFGTAPGIESLPKPPAMRSSGVCLPWGVNCRCKQACASLLNPAVLSAGIWPTSAVRYWSVKQAAWH